VTKIAYEKKYGSIAKLEAVFDLSKITRNIKTTPDNIIPDLYNRSLQFNLEALKAKD
jgi:hypothetical protein